MNGTLATIDYDAQLAVITIDSPPHNTITTAVCAALGEAVAAVESRVDVRGVLLRCAGGSFCGGLNAGEVGGPPGTEECRALFHRIEQLAVPVVALLHGTALGGGLELAMACHYRVAVPTARFGLPEVTLGVIPGAGGTQRLPRLIGVEHALELVLDAKPVDALAGLRLGLIDAILEGEPVSAALTYLRQRVAAGEAPRRSCDLAVPPRSTGAAVVRDAALKAQQMYPDRIAPFSAIKAISAAARLGFARGLEYENVLLKEARRKSAQPRVTILNWVEARDIALPLRVAVFVEEQGVPADIEHDDWDRRSLHAVASDVRGVIGTGRLLPDGHIGRMAVRRDARGQGVGTALLQALIAEARRRGLRKLALHAQTAAAPFYLRHGFVVRGPPFVEAGIVHVLMEMDCLQTPLAEA